MIKIFNTLIGKKEDFIPREKGHVYMYVCGPTVYGLMHIGNVRTFTTFDVIYRYFKWKGFKVKYVQNITDVGHLTDMGQDKIISGAKKMNMNVFDFVNLMSKNYLEDLKAMNILKPDISPRASEHVQDMIEVIKKLIENGYAYESNGYVYLTNTAGFLNKIQNTWRSRERKFMAKRGTKATLYCGSRLLRTIR